VAAITAGYAIDLHTHSLRSDGALSPVDLVKRAAARGVKVQALSDHDTLAGVAEAVARMGVRHAVITTVNRDDLPDGGAAHWAETVRQVRALNPECKVEVLIPDFNGDEDALKTVLDAQPDVLNHNTETIARLYRRVRPDADYQQSLTVLRRAAERRDREGRGMLTKSGIMVGLGETFAEVVELMKDLRAASCDIMTIGQYLQPHARRLPVERYVTPEEFARWRELGMEMGFHHVESSPLTRSSYHARQQAESEPRQTENKPQIYADARG